MERCILMITHIRVKLRHAVGNRCSSRKGHTLSACDLIKILTLSKHIRGLLCFRLYNAADIPHFGIEKQ